MLATPTEFPAAGSLALLDGCRVTIAQHRPDGMVNVHIHGRGGDVVTTKVVEEDELLPLGADLEREPDLEFIAYEAARLGKAA